MKLKNIFTAFFKKFYKCLYFSWKTGGKKKGHLSTGKLPELLSWLLWLGQAEAGSEFNLFLTYEWLGKKPQEIASCIQWCSTPLNAVRSRAAHRRTHSSVCLKKQMTFDFYWSTLFIVTERDIKRQTQKEVCFTIVSFTKWHQTPGLVRYSVRGLDLLQSPPLAFRGLKYLNHRLLSYRVWKAESRISSAGAGSLSF